jgi:TonB family protein
MRQGLAMLFVGILALTNLLAGDWLYGQDTGGKYHAADIAEGGNIAYPMNAKTPGFVTLDVGVDASGSVQNVSVLRDIPPLTVAAQTAVHGWQFTGASLDGQHVAGTVRVNVAFNPFNPAGVGLPGESLQAPTGGAGGKFVPAGLTKASYASYPPNTVVGGTVVMKVAVGKSGKIHGVTVVSGTGVLNDAAAAAAKNWAFTPATYGGKPVGSEVVVAFVFASAEAGTR